jgi:hypothetical protein
VTSTEKEEETRASGESSGDESGGGGGGEDFEISEFEPTKPKDTSLPTMEQERESTVEAEARWEKEHKMEPEEPQYEV